MCNTHSKVHVLHMIYVAHMTYSMTGYSSPYHYSGNRLEDIANIFLAHTFLFMITVFYCELLNEGRNERKNCVLQWSHPRKNLALA